MRCICLRVILAMFIISSVKVVINQPSSARSIPKNTVAQQISTNITPQVDYLSQLEKEVIVEMNKVRTNPQSYIIIMEEYKKRFQGNKVKIGKRKFMQTQEGIAAVDEAITFLKSQSSVGELGISQGMSAAARDHVNDQGKRGTFGHYGSDSSDPFIRMNRYGKGA